LDRIIGDEGVNTLGSTGGEDKIFHTAHVFPVHFSLHRNTIKILIKDPHLPDIKAASKIEEKI
jgi:hypothetical protein